MNCLLCPRAFCCTETGNYTYCFTESPMRNTLLGFRADCLCSHHDWSSGSYHVGKRNRGWLWEILMTQDVSKTFVFFFSLIQGNYGFLLPNVFLLRYRKVLASYYEQRRRLRRVSRLNCQIYLAGKECTLRSWRHIASAATLSLIFPSSLLDTNDLS